MLKVKVTKPKPDPKPRNKFEQAAFVFLTKNKVYFRYEGSFINYSLNRKYIPDFVIFNKVTGLPKLTIELKGFFRAVDQVKMKAVKAANPNLDIRIVFQDASKKIRKGATLTYGEWATKWGFKFAEGQIPKSWLK